MARTAIISVDGHVRASRSEYRDYIEKRYLDAFDEWARAQEAAGAPESGNLSPGLDPTSQWDSDLRMKDMESQGVVAEVLFPNGLPFQSRSSDDVGAVSDPELLRQSRLAYNRWLADFSALTPGRRSGQALVGFEDVDLAVADIRWAKEHGLGGVMMPALQPGGTFFFDPALDPVWAECVELDLTISQHGGSGAPVYGPPGFAAIMTLALEHSFYSGRSLWQLILGGVFERFPGLRVAFVETEADSIGPAIRKLDRRLSWGDDWTGWAQIMQRSRSFSRRARILGRQLLLGHLAVHGQPGAARGAGAAERRVRGVRHRLRQRHVRGRLPALRVGVPRDLGPGRRAGLPPEHHARGGAGKILCENAAAVYGFDLRRLQPDVERVGFDVEHPLVHALP